MLSRKGPSQLKGEGYLPLSNELLQPVGYKSSSRVCLDVSAAVHNQQILGLDRISSCATAHSRQEVSVLRAIIDTVIVLPIPGKKIDEVVAALNEITTLENRYENHSPSLLDNKHRCSRYVSRITWGIQKRVG
jgi:hypothetical protein